MRNIPTWADETENTLATHLADITALRQSIERRSASLSDHPKAHDFDDVLAALDDEIKATKHSIKSLPDLIHREDADRAADYADYRRDQMRDDAMLWGDAA